MDIQLLLNRAELQFLMKQEIFVVIEVLTVTLQNEKNYSKKLKERLSSPPWGQLLQV